MYTPHFTITPLILKNIEEIGRIFGYLNAVQLPTSYKQEFIEKIAAETVHSSTAIEGNTLTQEQVLQVIRGEKIHAIEKDVREAKNYYQILEDIRAIAQHTNQFTQRTVLELHKTLLSGIDDDIAGTYRSRQVHVGSYLPPEFLQIPHLMADFITWLNQPTPQDLSIILYAGIAHYQLVAIHPFVDGNGRTTRALITLYFMKHGFDITGSFALESYYNRERQAYYATLSSADSHRDSSGNPDLTTWLEYFTTAFLVEAERAQSRIQQFLVTQKTLSGISLTNTQKDLLKITAQKGTAQMADYMTPLQLSQGGVYKALQKLIEIGLLSQTGENKGSRYTITEMGLGYLNTSFAVLYMSEQSRRELQGDDAYDLEEKREGL